MKILLRLLIFLDLVAIAPSLVLFIPTGMLFDGGYTNKALMGFIAILAVPVSLATCLVLAVRYRRLGLDARAVAAASVPWLVALVSVLLLAIS
ncbi:hypothetical protein [Piscinibacter defluvii]|uniref:hypothetical protein n=1 Tax=Piscinibacter defluvii TaxID=1796922 RepID=UPI000FDDFEDE|nr:hypothetical protein [Piscinibacter defluvii]